MFRGSPGLTAEQLADIGSILGGDFNANTREGLTQYLFTVPAEDLDIALHIEALRMRAVLASPKEWQHERGAIEQEVAQDCPSRAICSLRSCGRACSPAPPTRTTLWARGRHSRRPPRRC